MQWQIQEQNSICRLERQGYGKYKFLAQWHIYSLEILAESCEMFFSLTLAITLCFLIFWKEVRVRFYRFLDFDGCWEIVFSNLILVSWYVSRLFLEVFPYENHPLWTCSNQAGFYNLARMLKRFVKKDRGLKGPLWDPLHPFTSRFLSSNQARHKPPQYPCSHWKWERMVPKILFL